MVTKIRERSQITLPAEILKKLNLKPGDSVDIDIEGDKIILKPVLVIDRSQAWFWTKEWQEMEREADEDIKNGRVFKADSYEELIKKLNS
ncbi:MAG: AbrB/MazE/SpoVT family DNA-binding domain-containing protein [Actinobacteria bacterium]|jgi:AbrB family looped-hinge helix DNA binding protein|nr:AbrB/MazE/SpoVT family DNA-binding domain-containing protein [Actinomycetota bacterium]